MEEVLREWENKEMESKINARARRKRMKGRKTDLKIQK